MDTSFGNFETLLKNLGRDTHISSTAYDTAWVARLIEFDSRMSNQAISWISENQLPDGSWGIAHPMYYHDRVICTLAAMIALTYRGRRAQDKQQIQKGMAALNEITSGATRGLSADPNGATVGFEVIIPTLVAEAENLGLIKQQKERILGRLRQLREQKMAKLAGLKISRLITVAHSVEMAGVDNLKLLDKENLQEVNGSVANSPASTAYFALYVKPGDARALQYLRDNLRSDGGFPAFAPFDLFERSWALWNLSLTAKRTDTTIQSLCIPHLEYLQQKWRPGSGLGFSASYSLPDGDDTMVGYEILKKYGYDVDLQAVLNYKEENCFRCYHLETKRSTDVNIHALGALREAGYPINEPTVQKLLNFIFSTRFPEGYWLDKWNVSPYYTTSHAIIVCAQYDPKLIAHSVDWILKAQKTDGSWGFYYLPTAEETAYCLQALIMWKRQGGNVSKEILKRGSLWLKENCNPPYPPFWIDKSLYCPELLVQSSILSALTLAEEEGLL